MFNIGDILLVKDSSDRIWGNLIISIINKNTVHGKLAPTAEFEEVKPLFTEHSNYLNSNNDKLLDETADKIVKLRVTLISEQDNNLFKPTAVFVN